MRTSEWRHLAGLEELEVHHDVLVVAGARVVLRYEFRPRLAAVSQHVGDPHLRTAANHDTLNT